MRGCRYSFFVTDLLPPSSLTAVPRGDSVIMTLVKPDIAIQDAAEGVEVLVCDLISDRCLDSREYLVNQVRRNNEDQERCIITESTPSYEAFYEEKNASLHPTFCRTSLGICFTDFRPATDSRA